MRLSLSLATAWITAVALVASLPLYAQSTQSSFLGTVTDSTGAPVRERGRHVATKVQTSSESLRQMKTETIGFPAWRRLLSGSSRRCRIQDLQRTQIDLASAQIKRIDIKLEVGDVATTVTVEGGTSQVETETATLSNLKTARDFAQLPLSVFGRGWANITNVTAGIQSTNGLEVNGARDTANNFTARWHFGERHDQQPQHRQRLLGRHRNVSGDQDPDREYLRRIRAGGAVRRRQQVRYEYATRQTLLGQLQQQVLGAQLGGPPSGVLHQPQHVRRERRRACLHPRNSTMAATRRSSFVSYSGARYRIGNRILTIVPTPPCARNFSALHGLIDDGRSAEQRRAFPGQSPFPANRISPVSQKLQNLLYPDPNQPGQGAYGMTQKLLRRSRRRLRFQCLFLPRRPQDQRPNNLLSSASVSLMTNGDTYPGPLKSGYGSSSC